MGVIFFQLFSVAESPCNSYRTHSGVISRLHICICVSDIKAFTSLYSKTCLLYTSRTGIRNILALKGDKPKDMSLTDFLNRTFKHASDMIHFIKTNEADKLFSIAAACYPEKQMCIRDSFMSVMSLYPDKFYLMRFHNF